MRRILVIIAFLSFAPIGSFGQNSFYASLTNLKGVSIKKITNPEFAESYELLIDQPLDHFGKSSPKFKQQVIVGINNLKAPVVMITEGYALGKIAKPDFIKECNVVYVEHRFFGKSKPDSLDWRFLTIKQAASDLHKIRELFGKTLEGRWLTTGASKGGQTAIAYKMFFPKDANATLAYVTPLKVSANDNRITTYLDSILSSECGKKVSAFQKFILCNKQTLYESFDKYASEKKYTFKRIGSQKAFEYAVLEYPFSFFQNCNDCQLIPDTLSDRAKIIDELVSVVSPKYFSDGFIPRLEPSFYMFYHELGYYEYKCETLKQCLSADTYPNSVFAPEGKINFDSSYLTEINRFISSPNAERIIFIYGENDPYTGAQPVLSSKKCLKLIAKNGCHKTRLDGLSDSQRKEVYASLTNWLKWTVGVD